MIPFVRAGVALTPLLIFKLCPPEIQKTPEAPEAASKELSSMGPMSRDQAIMTGTMLFAVTLWVIWKIICLET